MSCSAIDLDREENSFARRTIVVNLPSPSLYKQVVFRQPCWKQDVRITRKAVSSHHSRAVSTPDACRIEALPSMVVVKRGNREATTSVLHSKSASSQFLVVDEAAEKGHSRSISLGNLDHYREHSHCLWPLEADTLERTRKRLQTPVKVRLPSTERMPSSCPSTSDSSLRSAATCSPSSSMESSIEQPSLTEDLPKAGLRSSNMFHHGYHPVRTPTPKLNGSQSSISLDGASSQASFSSTSWLGTPEMIYSPAVPAPLNFAKKDHQILLTGDPALRMRQKTLEMYRANVKKTTDVEALYSFAVLLIDTAQNLPKATEKILKHSSADLLSEARHILQRLSDKGYAFAQYYLADGYAAGLYNNKGKFDDDKALPLFIAAGKHGHAEAGYRAACCFELGWGTRVDHTKAIQFYRQSASKNHVGAMTRLARAWIFQDLGGGIPYREGIKWLKRATVSATKQYNTAPYDLGCLHETGDGHDVFKDEAYAVQLFIQAAELDHADAAFKVGQAYERGTLSCPQDAGLSIQFYAMAAAKGHAQAMFALCAWYMVGAESILEIDEVEAYEWARKAAQLGLVQAQYAVGYFTEVGLGGRSDPLEANAWYMLAAEQGDLRAIERIKVIQKTANGEYSTTSNLKPRDRLRDGSGHGDERPNRRWKLFRSAT